MACIVSKITYRLCGHSDHHVIACRCGRGRRNCDYKNGRVILSTSQPITCPRDTVALFRRSQDAFQVFVEGRLVELGYSPGASSQGNRPNAFELECMRSLRTFVERRRRYKRQKCVARCASAEAASRWTKDLGVDLYYAMFGSEDERESAEDGMRRYWVQKSRRLKVIEHGLLSGKLLQSVQEELDATGVLSQRTAAVMRLEFSQVPAVPAFSK